MPVNLLQSELLTGLLYLQRFSQNRACVVELEKNDIQINILAGLERKRHVRFLVKRKRKILGFAVMLFVLQYIDILLREIIHVRYSVHRG